MLKHLLYLFSSALGVTLVDCCEFYVGLVSLKEFLLHLLKLYRHKPIIGSTLNINRITLQIAQGQYLPLALQSLDQLNALSKTPVLRFSIKHT